MRIPNIKRPEYFLNPAKIFTRLSSKPMAEEICSTAWGYQMRVNTSDAIGKSIFNTGVYDLALTEVLWRIIEPGDFVTDIGANIGYTTGICSYRVGLQGMVYAFEPNPNVLPRLKSNLKNFSIDNVKLFEVGLSDAATTGQLVLPEGFNQNEGIAFVSKNKVDKSIEVRLERLEDTVPPGKTVNVLKVDVEGHELEVLQGATGLLEQRRIRNILFEDHNPHPSKVTQLLQNFGFDIYLIEKGWLSVLLKEPSSKSHGSSFEPTNYLATLDKPSVLARMSGWGYRCLTRKG